MDDQRAGQTEEKSPEITGQEAKVVVCRRGQAINPRSDGVQNKHRWSKRLRKQITIAVYAVDEPPV
jgi:hypothetical protein